MLSNLWRTERQRPNRHTYTKVKTEGPKQTMYIGIRYLKNVIIGSPTSIFSLSRAVLNTRTFPITGHHLCLFLVITWHTLLFWNHEICTRETSANVIVIQDFHFLLRKSKKIDDILEYPCFCIVFKLFLFLGLKKYGNSFYQSIMRVTRDRDY